MTEPLDEEAAARVEAELKKLAPPLRDFFLEELRLAREARKIAYRNLEPARKLIGVAEQYAEKFEEMFDRNVQLTKELLEMKERLRRVEGVLKIKGAD